MPNGSPDTPVAAAHADAQAASAHDASVPSGTSSAMEREPVENLAEASQEEAAQLLKRKTSSKSLSTAVARRALQEAVEHDAVASVARARSVNSSPAGNSVPLPNTAAARSRLPAVIVVKVCRTPTSGSYDEFPRCGPGRAEAKAADVLLSSGRYIDPDQKHTRIVRGELRMFKFLQAAAAAEGLSQRHTHLVRLIADVSMTQSCELAKLCGDIDSAEATMAATPQPMAGGPPLPRLLVFERLVDLDVMLTPRGWVKNRGLWTVEQVEGVAREVAAGLKVGRCGRASHRAQLTPFRSSCTLTAWCTVTSSRRISCAAPRPASSSSSTLVLRGDGSACPSRRRSLPPSSRRSTR
jgi:hypothetical protein